MSRGKKAVREDHLGNRMPEGITYRKQTNRWATKDGTIRTRSYHRYCLQQWSDGIMHYGRTFPTLDEAMAELPAFQRKIKKAIKK